jgi:tetratricopeptide (TPR) repeat protein
MKAALVDNSALENLLWLSGVVGLVTWGRTGRREAALAAFSGTPLLVIPLLFPPIDRYAIVALPAFALGAASCLDRIRRFPLLSNALLAGIGIVGFAGSFRGAIEYHWRGRSAEFRVAMEKGDLPAAEKFLHEGLVLDPKNPLVYESLGDVHAKRGNPEAAEQAYMEAVKIGGDPVRLASALGEMGHVRQAEQLILPLRVSPPDNPDYWILEGNLAMAKKDGRFAAHCFLRALEAGADSSLVLPFLQMARALSRENATPPPNNAR